MNRVKTGIQGLDDIIAGGFPQKTNILLCGQNNKYLNFFKYFGLKLVPIGLMGGVQIALSY